MQQFDELSNNEIADSFDTDSSNELIDSFENTPNNNVIDSFEDNQDSLTSSFDNEEAVVSSFENTDDIIQSFEGHDLQKIAHFIDTDIQDIFDTEDYDESEKIYDSFDSNEEETIEESVSQDFEEAFLQKKIKKLINKRQKANLQDTLDDLITKTNKAKDEIRAYINNVHPVYAMSYKSSQGFSWGNHNFFSVLGSIFEKEYYSSLDRYQQTLTFDKFLKTNIKTRLLELGNRLDSSVRELLKSLDDFYPTDLLQSEAAIHAFKNKIKTFITHLELRDTGKNIARTEISNMRIKLSDQYISCDVLNFTEETCCFTAGYTFDNSIIYFVCGSCGEIHEMLQAPLKLVHLPFRGKEVNDKNYVLLDSIYSHKCPKCGKHNVLTSHEYELLHKSLLNPMLSSLEEYSKISQSTCNSFAITEYTLSNNILVETLPHLIRDCPAEISQKRNTEIIDESSTTLDEEQEYKNSCLDQEFKVALDNYRELLRSFKVSVKQDLSPINNIPKGDWKKGVLGAIVPYNINIQECVENLYKEQTKYNLNILTKFICATISVDYATLRECAMNSLLLYLKASPLSFSLGFKRIAIQKALINSQGIVDALDTLDDNQLTKLLPYLKDLSRAKSTDLTVIKESLTAYFTKCEESLKSLELDQKSLINQLKYCTRLFAFVPITKAPKSEEAKDFLYNPEFVDFVNVTTDLMIITQHLERFIRLWKARTSNKALSSLKNIENINSINNLQYSLDLYAELGLMSLAKGYSKDTKIIEGQKLFAITHSLFDFKYLEGLNPLHKSFMENDEFELFRNILALEDLTSSFIGLGNTKIYNYDTAVFTPIRETISKLLPIAKEFKRLHGITDEDKLFYYLHEYFTKEEIHAEFSPRFSSITLTKLIPRNDKESLQNYLVRLVNAQQQNSRELKFAEPKYLTDLFEHFAVLHSCNLPAMFFANVKELHSYLAFIEIIYFSLNFSLEKALSALKINPNILGKFITNYDQICKLEDSTIAFKKIQMLHSITTSPEFNNFGDFSELYLSDAFDKVDLDMSDEERLEVIENNHEDYLKSIKHLKEVSFVEYFDFKE